MILVYPIYYREKEEENKASRIYIDFLFCNCRNLDRNKNRDNIHSLRDFE